MKKINKLNMESKDILSENISNIADLFPNALVETEDGKKIDFDILRQELSKDIVEGNRERYHLDFPGKKEAIIEANRKTTKTLRPLKDKSVDFDNTKNIYIEGDNLEALKILQESYLGKIKCIYIDPPYNTGNDFVYNDKFSRSTKEEMIADGRMDEDGNILISKDINNDSNGRYHSDWLKMMYPRLKLARNLLSDDGVIFISIDDNEVNTLIDISNEIFGEHNHIGNISRLMKSGGNKGEYFSPNIEYILVYAKNKTCVAPFREEITDEIADKSYNLVETDGTRKGERFAIKGLCQPGLGIRPNQRYWVECPDGSFVIPKGANFPKKIKDGEKILPTDEDTCWRWSDIRYLEEKKKGNIFIK